MQPSSKRRLVGGAAALMLLGATLLSTAGVAVASPPRWVMDVVALPDSVTPGADAGYQVTITNLGPSNISQLFLVNDPTKGNPTYVDDSGPGRDACVGVQPDGSVPLSCSFGALNAGDHVTVIVGYKTFGSGTFDPVLEGTSNGTSFQDPKRSHGDTLIDLDFTGTVLFADKNKGGGFVTHGQVVSNFAKLNGQNKQNTGVGNLPIGTAATVQDGPNYNPWTCIDEPAKNIVCSDLSTEWSSVNAGTGGPYSTGAIVVLIQISGGVPGWFLHVKADNSQERINQCPGNVYDGSVTPCFTWDSSTKTVSIYTLFNGPYRG